MKPETLDKIDKTIETLAEHITENVGRDNVEENTLALAKLVEARAGCVNLHLDHH